MRKINYLFAALAAVLVCSCKPDYDKIANKLKDNVQEVTADFFNQIDKIEDRQSPEAVALTEKTLAKLSRISTKALKKNADNPVGPIAMGYVADFVEPELIEEYFNLLSEENQNNPNLARVKKSIELAKLRDSQTEFVDFEIGDKKFSDFVGQGKVVLVDFWASWCGPCKQEIPNIADVYAKYAGESFDVLSVAVWDKPEDAEAAATEHGVVWNHLVDDKNLASEAYHFDSIPTILLFDADGKIIGKNLRGADIEKAVAAALGR